MALINAHFYSLMLGQCTDVNILMPQNVTPGEEIPVLYLLHGYSDDCTIWVRRTALERYVGDRKLCVIMPSAHASWYTDCPAGSYFKYVSDELPDIMHRFFPTLSSRRETTYISGLSMGGYGAMKCALTHPERYSFVAPLSAAFDIAYRLDRAPLFKMLFGTETEFKGSANDLFALADKVDVKSFPKLYIACGQEDECCLYDNQTFPKKLQEKGFDFEFVFDHGHHSWEYWDSHIKEVLSRIPV